MKIIFIRHGDPDYSNDTLTEKGWREAHLLAERVSKWDVKDFYCSPLGRAQATASCSLKKMNRSATTFDWMKEFYYPITDPVTGRYGVPWDFMPSYWTKEPLFYDKDHWHEAPVLQSNSQIKPAFDEVSDGIDGILAKYGYIRDGLLYRTDVVNVSDTDMSVITKSYSDDTIVIFCHLGVALVMMSHLLGIAPTLLWQNFFLAPTSVTILVTEERIPGEAYFRSQVVGDTSHLHDGKEPISQAGYFAEPFQL
ncbi:MAG: histidine phosphatase family protein [Clostridiales bacterium]|nr:histidine phosphatase family protein [Clostridiales bacterium]